MNQPKERTPLWFLLGPFGRMNMGDDAMMFSVLSQLRSTYPHSKFLIFSESPCAVPDDLKSSAILIPRTVSSALSASIKASATVITGGTHLHDHGCYRFRWASVLFRILVLILASKVVGKRVFLIGNGIGPLHSYPVHFLAKAILKMADFISVRERYSYQVVKSVCPEKRVILSFDPAVLLASERMRNRKRRKKLQILGISLLPVYKLYYGRPSMDISFASKVAQGLQYWITRSGGSVRICVFNGSVGGGDLEISSILRNSLSPVEHVEIIPYTRDPSEMLEQVGRCDAFIAMRFHAYVFAYAMGLPLLGIDYHPKCRAFCSYVGLPENAIMTLEDIMKGKLINKLSFLMDQPDRFLATKPLSMATEEARRGFHPLSLRMV